MPTGFFGKLPQAGDFVSRGLETGVRPALDRWLTKHLAQHDIWPETSLHALIKGPSGTLALAILPSQDALGRAFPLAACASTANTDRACVEDWGKTVTPALLDAVAGVLSADALYAIVAPLPDPKHSDQPLTPPLLWADQTPAPLPEAIQQIFGQTQRSTA